MYNEQGQIILARPIVGSWYDSDAINHSFRVVAGDPAHVEIQYLDGSIEELGQDEWWHLMPYEVPDPEDANSGYQLSPEDEMELLDPEFDRNFDLEDLREDFEEYLERNTREEL